MLPSEQSFLVLHSTHKLDMASQIGTLGSLHGCAEEHFNVVHVSYGFPSLCNQPFCVHLTSIIVLFPGLSPHSNATCAPKDVDSETV